MTEFWADEPTLEEQPAAATPVDWHALFARDPDAPPDWLVEPIIEAGRSTALYAPQKAGKSLLTLELVAAVAAGRPVLGNAARPARDVLYLDFENSPDDLYERLVDFGYGPDDLARLHYYAFPALDALDSRQGGEQVLELVQRHDAALVVVDTTSRVIAGEENSSDTFRALYRWTFLPLKRAGVAAIRLDHAGKDSTKGQRGSSGKGDDVDYVWRLTDHGAGRITLKREASRTRHGAEHLSLTRRAADPANATRLRHLLDGALVVPPAIEACVVALDRLHVPDGSGRDVSRAALISGGYKVGTSTLAQAVAFRKERAKRAADLSGTGPSVVLPAGPRTPDLAPWDDDDETTGQTCPGQVEVRSRTGAPVPRDDLSRTAAPPERGQVPDSVVAPDPDSLRYCSECGFPVTDDPTATECRSHRGAAA